MTSIYIGTYAKYNAGSIEGKWLDPSEYDNLEDFLTACKELHKDETDPELMFQDYEGFPEGFYSESGIRPELWDYWIGRDSAEREAISAFLQLYNVEDLGSFEESYCGTYESGADWAAEYIESAYDLQTLGDLAYYIDYGKFARDAVWNGDIRFVGQDGYVHAFHNC